MLAVNNEMILDILFENAFWFAFYSEPVGHIRHLFTGWIGQLPMGNENWGIEDHKYSYSSSQKLRFLQ